MSNKGICEVVLQAKYTVNVGNAKTRSAKIPDSYALNPTLIRNLNNCVENIIQHIVAKTRGHFNSAS